MPPLERVSSGGKGVAAVTSATRVRFALGGTIYIAWVPGKEVKTPFFWSSGIGTPAGVPAPEFEPWPLRNLHVGCSIRDRRPLYGEPHGDALAASMLTSVSSLQARPSTKAHEALALGHII